MHLNSARDKIELNKGENVPSGTPGKVPAKCHPDRPHVARGLCASCYQREWKLANPEKVAARIKKPANCHPDRPALGRGLCGTCYRREWRKENPERNREAGVRRYRRKAADPEFRKTHARRVRAHRYGLTLAELDELLASLSEKCAVCGSTRDLHIDHCHSTGKIRGILCGRCNNAAGQTGDDPERLRAIADYLEAGGSIGPSGSSGSPPSESPGV